MPQTARFGDVTEPTLADDAANFLKLTLDEIRRAHGDGCRLAASFMLASLGANDGLHRSDLEDAVAFDLDYRTAPELRRVALATDELIVRSIVEVRGGRVFLNPAAAAVIGGER